jgi:hypothetical protein
LIWRRLLIRGDTTLATLHTILQCAFAWEDDHLDAFHIYGRDYGTGLDAANASRIPLGALQPRCKDRFRYTYTFDANWVHEIRVEASLPLDPRRPYPWWCAGARAAPPDACRGPQEFLALRQHYHLLRVVDELVACLRPADPAARVSAWDEDDLDGDNDDDDGNGIDREARFEELRFWLLVDPFDRRALNRRLRTLSCPPGMNETEAVDAGSDSGSHH